MNFLPVPHSSSCRLVTHALTADRQSGIQRLYTRRLARGKRERVKEGRGGVSKEKGFKKPVSKTGGKMDRHADTQVKGWTTDRGKK